MAVIRRGERHGKPAPRPRGAQPFLERLKRLDEELVIAGTGGTLTMLSDPTGLGQGASGAQADVFADSAAAEALEISEVFQKQFDALLLAEKFPGQPVLAYFELAAPEQEDIGAIIEHAFKLAQAGYALDAEELSERTGYRLVATDAHGLDTDGGPRSVASDALPNRSLWARIKALVNAGTSEGAEKGWETRRANGWTPQEAAAEQKRGEAGIEKALQTHADVPNAMHHETLGSIDFKWGSTGDGPPDYEGGYGIAKILAKHGEPSVRMIPTVIAHGAVTKVDGNTTRIEHNAWRAILTKTAGRDENHWVLSAYLPKKKGGVE